MHELSIADAIVRIATAHAGGRKIETVEVKVGHLRQVVPDALTFAFDPRRRGHRGRGRGAAAGSGARRRRSAGVCGIESELPGFPLACEACGSLDVELVRGEELLVDALTMEGVPSGRS